MKKTILTILAVAATAFSLSSCDSWIKESPDDQITEEKVGDSDDAANSWVTGVYSKWIYDMFCWGYFPRVLEIDADYISGPDWMFNKFGTGNFQGENDVTDALWNGCYGLIKRANLAELRINEMQSLTEKAKNNYIGEVQFQKALAYFLLVRAYGEVPIQAEDNKYDNVSQPRQAVDKVYDYIIATLESAAAKMYKNTDAAYSEGHVSAGSAAGLLAKVYATEASSAMPAGTPITIRSGKTYNGSGDTQTYAPLRSINLEKTAVSGYENLDSKALYTKAAEWAKKVIDGEYGSYELLDYDNLWKKASATASEFMFSVGSVSGDATYKNAIHTQYNGYLTATGSDFIQEGGWIGCTRHWYDLFDHDDFRIVKGVKHRWRAYTQEKSNSGFYYPRDEEYTVMATGYDLNGNHVGDPQGIFADGVSYYYSMDSQCLAFTTKYADVTNDAIKDADANWPFLRYADVLLIYAEAENELGQQSEAIKYLNMVRKRSNATPAKAEGNGALDTQTKLRSAIIEERAKEFACEGDRRWDLIRWGIYLDAMNAIEGSDDSGISKVRESRTLLYPLPATEINTNKYITTNNPGWN